MSFFADKQTLDDLNILGKYKSDSIYNLFNQTHTSGGEKLLDSMFRNPMSEFEKLNNRIAIFQFFGSTDFAFPFDKEQFGIIENYMSSGGGENIVASILSSFRRKFLTYIGLDQEYNLVKAGLTTSIELLNVLLDFLSTIQKRDPENPYRDQITTVVKILEGKKLRWLRKERGVTELPLTKIARYDYLLRNSLQEEMKRIFQVIYELDVFIAVSNVAGDRKFTYARALPAERNMIQIEGLYHPCLEKAILNNVSFSRNSNVFFLTGANMAGKSTLMKSFGVSVYLAHIGFPIAAKKMEFSVRDGIFSSINVSDNLDLGYSHFYAEVLRVKKVAIEVAKGRNLVVLFDELFKGTNVKDAYDATLAVTEAFSENRNCTFLVSTHIVEVGEALRQRCDNLQYYYLPTVMKGKIPQYTYKLLEGISSDRHGMLIIKNERILEIILGEETIGNSDMANNIIKPVIR